MIIIWGSRLYGKVDDVPGMFHVATKFGHVWYIPLIPLGSHLVIEKSGDGWRGAPVPLSFKSILVAWLRAALLVATVIAAIAAIANFSDARVQTTTKVVACVAAAALLALTILSFSLKFITRASYERARKLAEHVGLSDEGHIMIELLYGRITKEDAEKALHQAAADRAEMQRLAAEQKPIPVS